MKCRNCGKVLIKKHEIEYSEELCEFFCSPDCATNQYYEDMRSYPISFEEMKEMTKEIEKCEEKK